MKNFQPRQLFAFILAVALSVPSLSKADEVSDRANAYLAALQATPGAIASINSMAGISLPFSGPVPPNQVTALQSLLFKADGSNTMAWDKPADSAVGVVRGFRFLQFLRGVPTRLQTYQNLTGIAFTPIGVLASGQLEILFSTLFDPNGTPTIVHALPDFAALSIFVASDYVNALRSTPGALTSLQGLSGRTLSTSGLLPTDQLLFVFQQLFDSKGVRSTAYTQPQLAAQSLSKGLTFLTALRTTAGALQGLQDVLGKTLPATGFLTNEDHFNILFGLLFKADGSQQMAYTQPQEAAAALTTANAVLQGLRSTPGALQALTDLFGKTLPTTGPLTNTTDIEYLFGLLFKQDGTRQTALWNNPTEAAQAVNQANALLKALRSSPGAVQAVQDLLGQALPVSGILTNVNQIDFLFGMLYKADGTKQTAIWADANEVAAALAKANDVIKTLRVSPGSLTALQQLVNIALPASGVLNQNQMEALLGLLYRADGSRQTAIWNDPAETAKAITQANVYLQALRTTPGALQALQELINQSLPASGFLSQTEVERLFSYLYKSDGTRQSGVWTNPTEAALALAQANAYLKALRASPGALEALAGISGTVFPANGVLNQAQLEALLALLYNADGSRQAAVWGNPAEAALALAKAWDYLNALRATPGALQALRDLTGQTLPSTGQLSSQDVAHLFAQLYKSDGSRQQAIWDNPTTAATGLVKANDLLKEFRAESGALSALASLTGRSIPGTGTLSAEQLADLFALLFDANQPGGVTVAYNNPKEAVQAIKRGKTYLDILQQTGAIRALNALTGANLPEAAGQVLTDAQLQVLFSQLYETGTTPSLAYSDPQRAATNLLRGKAYLDALRATPEALTALDYLTGKTLPATGVLTKDQLTTLFALLVQSADSAFKPCSGDATLTKASCNPTGASTDLVRAMAYLQALRATPNALQRLAATSGTLLPASGPLSSQELSFLFSLLYDASGNPTKAYNDPQGAAKDLVPAIPTPSGSKKGGSKWLAIGLGLAAVGVGLLFWKPWAGAAIGVAAATALALSALGTSKTSGIPGGLNASKGTKLEAVVIPADAPNYVAPSIAKPTGGQSLVQVISADSKSSFVSPTSPNNSYIPLKQQGAARSSFDQFRWLTQAESGRASAIDRRQALNNAAASNKNVGVISPADHR